MYSVNWILVEKVFCFLLFCFFREINSALLWASAGPCGRPESQGGPRFVWALNLAGFRGFPPPRAGWKGCWLHILIPPSLRPSIPQCPVYTRRPCGCATSETLQTTKALAATSTSPVAGARHGNWERCCRGWRSGADGGLAVGNFSFLRRQAGDWRYDYMWPGLALKCMLFALCGQVTSPHRENHKMVGEKKGNNIRL